MNGRQVMTEKLPKLGHFDVKVESQRITNACLAKTTPVENNQIRLHISCKKARSLNQKNSLIGEHNIV